MAAMPPIGMGSLETSPARAGATAAGANAAAALFATGYGPRPGYGGNPFLRGIFGLADRAGGRTTDPGARYKRAIGQGDLLYPLQHLRPPHRHPS